MDDELDAGQRSMVESHLRECPLCRHHLSEMRGLSEQLYAWLEPPRHLEEHRSFSARVMAHLPSRPVEESSRQAVRQSRSFLFPVSLVITGALVQSAALITVILSGLIVLGVLDETISWFDQAMAEVPSLSLNSVSQFTSVGWVTSQILSLFGQTGTELSRWGGVALDVVLPALVLLAFMCVVFLGLSGWAGLQLSRRHL